MRCIGRDVQLRHQVRSMYATILGISLGDRAYYTVSVRIRTIVTSENQLIAFQQLAYIFIQRHQY